MTGLTGNTDWPEARHVLESTKEIFDGSDDATQTPVTTLNDEGIITFGVPTVDAAFVTYSAGVITFGGFEVGATRQVNATLTANVERTASNQEIQPVIYGRLNGVVIPFPRSQRLDDQNVSWEFHRTTRLPVVNGDTLALYFMRSNHNGAVNDGILEPLDLTAQGLGIIPSANLTITLIHENGSFSGFSL